VTNGPANETENFALAIDHFLAEVFIGLEVNAFEDHLIANVKQERVVRVSGKDWRRGPAND
jgi:hypothetical protein